LFNLKWRCGIKVGFNQWPGGKQQQKLQQRQQNQVRNEEQTASRLSNSRFYRISLKDF